MSNYRTRKRKRILRRRFEEEFDSYDTPPVTPVEPPQEVDLGAHFISGLIIGSTSSGTFLGSQSEHPNRYLESLRPPEYAAAHYVALDDYWANNGKPDNWNTLTSLNKRNKYFESFGIPNTAGANQRIAFWVVGHLWDLVASYENDNLSGTDPRLIDVTPSGEVDKLFIVDMSLDAASESRQVVYLRGLSQGLKTILKRSSGNYATVGEALLREGAAFSQSSYTDATLSRSTVGATWFSARSLSLQNPYFEVDNVIAWADLGPVFGPEVNSGALAMAANPGDARPAGTVTAMVIGRAVAGS